MKNMIRVSTMVAAVLALASVGAYANSSTTNIGLSATVSSFDNITCTQSTGGINFGSSITTSGLTSAQAVNCSVTSNDTSAIDVTAYVPHAAPLADTGTDTIANTNIQWSATSGGTYASFAALSGSLSTDDGAVVAQSVTIGYSTAVDFYLKLNVPAAQPAGDYDATMTVAITPHA
jgi:hypothetical protein